MLDDLSSRLGEAMRASPVQDVEKNLRALLVAFFDRFDLVAREDFEVQKKLLARAQEKLAALEMPMIRVPFVYAKSYAKTAVELISLHLEDELKAPLA